MTVYLINQLHSLINQSYCLELNYFRVETLQRCFINSIKVFFRYTALPLLLGLCLLLLICTNVIAIHSICFEMTQHLVYVQVTPQQKTSYRQSLSSTQQFLSYLFFTFVSKRYLSNAQLFQQLQQSLQFRASPWLSELTSVKKSVLELWLKLSLLVILFKQLLPSTKKCSTSRIYIA